MHVTSNLANEQYSVSIILEALPMVPHSGMAPLDYSYRSNKLADFPFESSQTVGAIDDLICNRLRSPWNAPRATIDLCYSSENAISSLTGQEAADKYNELMTSEFLLSSID
jgi:hypothetical protein